MTASDLIRTADETRLEAWTEAFVAAQAKMPEIVKDKTANIPTKSGNSFKYSYADLPSIIEKVRPVLAEHGLAVAQSVEGEPGRVAVFTQIIHKGGHVATFGPVVIPGGNDAQSAGSAITYARRYGLCAALGIAADEDDDGKSGSAGASVPTTSASSGSPAAHASASASQVQDQGGGATTGVGPSQDGSDASLLAPFLACLKSPGNPDGLTKLQMLKVGRAVAEQEDVTPPPAAFEDLALLPAPAYDEAISRCRGRLVPQ